MPVGEDHETDALFSLLRLLSPLREIGSAVPPAGAIPSFGFVLLTIDFPTLETGLISVRPQENTSK
jgi:hypothetical protein